MTRAVRRIALYGFLGSGNLGNDASLETVVSWLRTHHPEVELRCITIAPEAVEARYGIPSEALAWEQGRRGGRLMAALAKVLGRLVDVPRHYRLAGSVDAIVVPGMGVLEDSLTVRPWGLPYWLVLAAVACRLRGRSFVLLDVGAERAANPVTRRLYATTVRLAAHVSYRDRRSAAAMAPAGGRHSPVIAPDLAFAHPSSTDSRPESGRIVAGVMAYYGPGDDPVRGAPVRRQYVETLAEALVTVAGEGSQIVLVGGDHVDIDVAEEVRTAVLSQCPDLPAGAVVVRAARTFAELSVEMGSAELVIASRFHNLIGALRLGRPTVSMGYADKCRDLMVAVGLPDYSQDIETLGADRLLAQVTAARQDGTALADRIRSTTSAYAVEVDALLHQVARDVLGLDSGVEIRRSAADHSRLGQR